MSTPSSNFDLNPGANVTAEAVPAWKHELNERLQATRGRRNRRAGSQASLPELEQFSKSDSRASRLAAKVAERYANAPSYSEILAAEARAAAVAAEAALAAAQEAHAAAQALLVELETGSGTAQQVSPQGSPQVFRSAAVDDTPSRHEREQAGAAEDGLAVRALDQAFFDQTLQDAVVLPAQPLPVNLIEFPRELIAARRARPRLAEGPLRDSYEETAHDPSQLRIFEVEPESISKEVKIAAAAEWSSIRLDAKPAVPSGGAQSCSSRELPVQAAPLQAAPLEDRLMAGIFDLALVLFAFVLFVLVFAACTAHPPTGKAAFIAAGLVLAGLSLLYQFLFFRFTEGTPGMHYAKIALCTFEDENPGRTAMRRRILFLLLSAAPLGLGFAWAWFDADRLGWHDRLTRMYQRSYR